MTAVLEGAPGIACVGCGVARDLRKGEAFIVALAARRRFRPADGAAVLRVGSAAVDLAIDRPPAPRAACALPASPASRIAWLAPPPPRPPPPKARPVAGADVALVGAPAFPSSTGTPRNGNPS